MEIGNFKRLVFYEKKIISSKNIKFSNKNSVKNMKMMFSTKKLIVLGFGPTILIAMLIDLYGHHIAQSRTRSERERPPLH